MYNQSAAQAYQNTIKHAGSSRDREAAVLIKAALMLESAKAEDASRADLRQALTFNRRIWVIFVTELTAKGHPMPKKLRENLVNLGIFTFKQTVYIQGHPKEKQKLDVLININRNIAAGLRANS